MTIEEAIQLIENLDYPEGLKRKFAPRFSLILIARDGSIACVNRYKARTTEAEQIESLNRFPGCVQIFGCPGRFSSIADFQNVVNESMFLFDKMRKRS